MFQNILNMQKPIQIKKNHFQNLKRSFSSISLNDTKEGGSDTTEGFHKHLISHGSLNFKNLRQNLPGYSQNHPLLVIIQKTI